MKVYEERVLNFLIELYLIRVHSKTVKGNSS